MSNFLRLFFLFLLLSTMSCTKTAIDPTACRRTSSRPGEEWVPPKEAISRTREKVGEKEKNLTIDQNSDIAKLLDVALRNHPLTKEAWAEALSVAFDYGAAMSSCYPEVTESVSLAYRDVSNGSGGTSSTTSNGAANTTSTGGNGTQGSSVTGRTQSVIGNLTLSYLLLDFGGRKASIDAARQALYSANWSQNRTIQQVIIGVIEGYYNFVSAKELLVAAESDLKNAKAGLDAAEALFESGVGQILAVLQFKANVAERELSLIQAKGAVEIYLAQLATALGISPSSKIDTSSLPTEFPLEEISHSLEELMEMAKSSRPDLAAAWATVRQKKREIEVNYSASLPSLRSSLYVENTKYIKNSNLAPHRYGAFVELDVPIFRGFYYINLIRRAKADYQAALASYENIESLVLLDVVTSYENFISAKDGLLSSEEFLKFSGESRNVAYESFQAGTATFLDLLAADSNLAQARAKNIKARADLGISLFTIAFSTGMLNVPYVAQSIEKRKERLSEMQ